MVDFGQVLHLESESVSSSHDARSGITSHTIRRGDKTWTARIPDKDLNACKGPTHIQQRRNLLAQAFMRAMMGPPDPLPSDLLPPSPRKGTEEDPHHPGTWAEFHDIPSGHWYVNAADGQILQKP